VDVGVGDHEDETQTQTLHLSVLEFEIPLFETKPATSRKVEGLVVVVHVCLEGIGEVKEEDRAAGGLEV
jgi:hypothetical protein